MKYLIFKPNVCYVMRFPNDTYYVGSVCKKRPYLSLGDILKGSGNPVRREVCLGTYSNESYLRDTEILEVLEFDTKEEAQKMEVEKIKEYKDKFGDRCLNKQVGNLYTGKLLPGEHKRRTPVSQETREKMRQVRLGMKYSDEAKLNISKGLGGRPVAQKDMNGNTLAVFPYVAEASRQTGVPKSSIQHCLRDRYKSAGGYKWEYN